MILFFAYWGCTKDEQTLSDAQLDVSGPAVQTEEDLGPASLELERIHFDFDRYNVKEEFRGSLQNLASQLASNEKLNLEIVGHCDQIGTPEYNLGLGNRRAESTKKYLEALGVDATRMSTVSMGEEQPLSSENNSTAHAQNRRAEFRIR